MFYTFGFLLAGCSDVCRDQYICVNNLTLGLSLYLLDEGNGGTNRPHDLCKKKVNY